MKRKIFIIIPFFMLFVVKTKAKEINKTANKIELVTNAVEESPDKNWLYSDLTFRFALGLTSFHGDIMQKQAVNPAFSAHLGIPIKNERYILEVGFIKGSISGKNSSSSVCENPYHTFEGVLIQHPTEGESFNMEFMEFDINFLMNLSILFDDKIKKRVFKNEKLDLLCKVGIGLNMFRSLSQELETEQFINSYGYEWMWQDDFANAGTKKNDHVKEGVFVLGIISKYKISDKVDINFSVTSRMGNTDKWDAKIKGQNDVFMFYSLGTNFSLGKD
jgi:hypothetical protein